jgi:carbon storage regulator
LSDLADHARKKEEGKMLVLSRKIGEKILIGNDVVVTISKVQGNRVWIGLEAPASVKILRDEIAHKEKETQPCNLR